MSLDDIKKKLDKIDFQILKLLNTRMELDLKSKKIGKLLEDSQLTADVIEKIRIQSGALITPQFCEKLFKDIITESKKLQSKGYQLIGFQGDHGAYSEVASKIWKKNLIPIPCNEFTEVFSGVTSGLFDFGIVPVENTLGGVVSQVNQLILNADIYVVGAIELSIHHCLLGLPGADHRELRVVYSHYQALEQCHHFLLRNKLEPIPYYDTAGAAKMLAETAPKMAAAIASKPCAKLYNLEIIKENIEDFNQNKTRFLVFAKKENKAAGSKCSIIFSTEHKAGTLFRVLEVFASKGLNLTRIESIPNQLGSFVFFLDFEGSREDGNVVKALEEVKKITTRFRLMGFYNESKEQ